MAHQLEIGTIQQMGHLAVEPGFLPEYDIDLLAGRNFRSDMNSDRQGGFVLNLAAVHALGWSSPEEALRQNITAGSQTREGPIVGVTDDFHWRGLQEVVSPMVLEWAPERFAFLTLSLSDPSAAHLLRLTVHDLTDAELQRLASDLADAVRAATLTKAG